MIVGEKFAWGHLGKTGGDATFALFRLFPELIIHADGTKTNNKHDSFAMREDEVKGKLLFLNIRRLPSWMLSRANHRARYGLYPDYQPLPMTIDEIVQSNMADQAINRFLDNGRFRIDRWIRLEYLKLDFLNVIEELTEVSEHRKQKVRELPITNSMRYDHDVNQWFTEEQLETMYENNPIWASIEQEVYQGKPVNLRYQQPLDHIREIVRTILPLGTTVAVASKGDDELLKLNVREAWHFPQNEEGTHADYYPADNAEAIAHLQEQQARGADYLLFPSTAFWWLERYREFRQHLDTWHQRVWDDERCIIYELLKMPFIEIVDIFLAERDVERLWDRHIDLPKPNTRTEASAVDIMGWVLGKSSPAVAVELLHDGEVIRRVPLNHRRPDLARAFPEVPGAENSGFRTNLSLLGATPEVELRVQAVLQDQSRVPIGVIRGRRAWGEMIAHLNAKDELKELILRSLSVNYSSVSKDGIKTGNHYQSVALGDIQTPGFRTHRGEFLDEVDFEGKKVLDLGSNLGEISRAARVRGAYLVDGFEYDQYFVQIANLINAYNGVTRVSFYQNDITDPSVYAEQYDIVLAFSVFTYVRSVLEYIAAITKELFVLETHKLQENLHADYLQPVLQYFPHHRILGESEWGTRLDAGERRAVIVFAKDASALIAALNAPLD